MTNKLSEHKSTLVHHSKFWGILALLIAAFVLTAVGIRLFARDSGPVRIGEKPEDFDLMTFSGEKVHTADLRGKVLVVNFWSSWCTTCDEEAVMLEEAWRKYQQEIPGQVVFLGVAYMDTERESLDFLSEYSVTYPNGPDLRGEISKIYQVTTVPETYILDPNGTLRSIKIGPFLSVGEIYSAVEAAQVVE